MISISVVFPVHNEEKNIKKLIHEWHLTLGKSNVDHEFILVEDGSKDETKKIIKELETSYPIINLGQDERRG
ncbi:MAG: glycosyltransferase, partial [SAR202 cluster bacterium]|nr:glycosyltransferase [SAR202 cluster bacterium]